MACAAVKTLDIRLGGDPRSIGLHIKPDVHMAEPARKLGAVQPMIEPGGRFF
jgi:hypothetical protein